MHATAPATECPETAHSPPLPELLAPAGDWECARAAVENGADAIYFGLERFNARMRAQNFTETDLPRLMEFLHSRGVKGYVTFNTLVFENELAEAEQYARSIIRAGVDAAIVQDVGICRLIRSISPDFPIHVSTQMTITSARGIAFARELGCNLVVLARECSLKEIGQMVASPDLPGLPLEVFVHGALCVAYSGQCLTSEALGGRSANRGECAQACRMPYDLLADGRLVELGDRKYLLSPQDLAGLQLLRELARLGIASLKIEGRLKAPEYVASITRIYRKALDSLPRGQADPAPLQQEDRYTMEMTFSRGLYTGWFHGINNQELVHARFGKKRGVFLGEIAEVRRDSVLLELQGPLKPGDGVVFDAGRPETPEEGGRVYQVLSSPKRLSELRFGRGDVNLAKVKPGNKLWKTSDPDLDRRLRQTFEGEALRFQRPLNLEVHGQEGSPLTLIGRESSGLCASAASTVPLTRAERQPLTPARLAEQLGRLGGTPFRLGALISHLSGNLMLPLSELNRLRRELVRELDRLRRQPLRWTVTASENALDPIHRNPTSRPAPNLIVLCRTLPQLRMALEMKVITLYCDLEDPRKYREAVQLVRTAAAGTYAPEIWAAPPRIFKMGEEWTLQQVRSSQADGYLVRNYDHLDYFKTDRKVGDYSLNVSNHLTADYFLGRFGLERLTASYDLNFGQLEALLRGAPPDWFEITIHQHMPMFHMEHCLFCAFLTHGTDYRDCGRPCDTRDLKLRDRVGAEHPVKADAGCRNTVFNSLAQTGAEYVGQMLDLGVRQFRIEFLNETPGQLAATVTKYRQLLQGEISGAQLWRELKLFNQLGVTRGQMPGSNR